MEGMVVAGRARTKQLCRMIRDAKNRICKDVKKRRGKRTGNLGPILGQEIKKTRRH